MANELSYPISLLFMFISDNVLPKAHDAIQFDGMMFDCNDFHTTDRSGTWCNCPFLACTGGQDCFGTIQCSITNKNYDYTNMKDEDCDCRAP